jgi:hypothetical protein
LFPVPKNKISGEFKVIAYKVYNENKKTKTKIYSSNLINIQLPPLFFYLK